MSLGFASFASGLAQGVSDVSQRNEASRLKAAQLFRQLQQDNPHATFADLVALRRQAAGGQNWLAKGVATDDMIKIISDGNAEKKRIFEEEQAAAALRRKAAAEEYLTTTYMDYAGQNDDDNAAFDAWQKSLPDNLKQSANEYMTPERRLRLRSKMVTDQTSELVRMAENGIGADELKLTGKRLGFNQGAIDAAVQRAKKIQEDQDWTRTQRRMQVDTHNRNIASHSASLMNTYAEMAAKMIVEGGDPNAFRDNYQMAGGTNWDGVLADANELARNGRAMKLIQTEGVIMDTVAPYIQAGTPEARERARQEASALAAASGYNSWDDERFESMVQKWEDKALVSSNTATRKAFLGEYSDQKDALIKAYDKDLDSGNFKTAIQGQLTGLVENIERDGASLITVGRELAETYYFGNPAMVGVHMRRAIAANPDGWSEIQDMDDDDPSRVERMKEFFDSSLDQSIRKVYKDQGISAEAARRAQAVSPHKMDWDEWSKGVKQDVAVLQEELIRLEKQGSVDPQHLRRVQAVAAEIASENSGVTQHSFVAPRLNEMDQLSKALGQLFERLDAIKAREAEKAAATQQQSGTDPLVPQTSRPAPKTPEEQEADRQRAEAVANRKRNQPLPPEFQKPLTEALRLPQGGGGTTRGPAR